MALVTYPLNNIEYSAEDAELFHATRTSGIYANNSFGYDITGADNNIVIGTGIGWIKNSEFSGKVIAQKEAISLDIGLPDPVYPRIDAIVIQFDNNRNETNIVVKKGTAASNPVAPSVVQNESVYELHLYHVRREAGSLYITPSNITDLRLNSSYCGLMADSVTNIDTTAIENQVSDLIRSLQDEISNVIDGSAYLLRDGSTNMTGNLPMDGYKVTGLGTPTADDDAVNLGFANENYRGSDWLPSVEEIGAASAGYGYGEPMVWLGLKDGTVTNTFQADLEALYASMPSGTCKQVQLADKSTFTNQKYCGTLWKYTPNFGVLTAANYGGFKVIKRIEDGQWEPWAIDNPNNALGRESTTSEFWNRDTVYRKIISVGKLPNNSEMSLTVEGASKIVSVNGYITNGKYDIPIFAPNSGISNMYFAKSSKLLYITTGSDRSTWDCYLDVKYTK